MLISTAYHRIGEGKWSNPLSLFTYHLQYIKDHYPTVLPGDPLPSRWDFYLCLTFDDAYFDFYHYVFPLLVKYNVKALLAVPVKYIVEKTRLAPSERLAIPYHVAMQEGIFEHKVPFCTWEELEEMARSGFVEIASHSYSHPNMTYPSIDLKLEIETSKKILEKRLPQEISTFVYPFGKTHGQLHKEVLKYYPYAFRIGSKINSSWDCRLKPLTRIPSDKLAAANSPFKPLFLFKTLVKSLVS
jgi:peptidoglycan/xylan/chitin deacetylase (PgdA/CDA1 family)